MKKTFLETINKFNPYHDAKGRFTTAGGATSMTYAPGKSKAHDNAIAREKERMARIMPTEAQAKTLKTIENKTRNLKKEQYRVVDREGNVVLHKQGDRHSVSKTIGEAREHLPGNITIHNHPDGGTFSSADLSDLGFGATEIRAASPEGTYMMRNVTKYGKPSRNQKTWYEMREDLETAATSFKTNRELKQEIRQSYHEQLKPMVEKWTKAKEAGAPMEELKRLANEYTAKVDALQPQIEADTRKAYVAQYHKWYKAHAGEYGIEYEFIPLKTKTQKMVEEVITKAVDTGEIVHDQDIADDVKEIANDIIESLKRTAQRMLMVEKANVMSFSDAIAKFNPYHDAKGRFTTANGATSFTYRTKDSSKQYLADKAIQRAKDDATASVALNSAGNELSKEQAAYFKNSKVRDANGNLMIVYHGTANAGEIQEFDGNKLSNREATSQIGQGFYFTNVKKEAESYTINVDPLTGRKSFGRNPHLHEVYLNITKPFEVGKDKLDLEKAKAVYMDGDYDYFFESTIPFRASGRTINGKKYTRAEIEQMSRKEKVDLYVDYVSNWGPSETRNTKEVLSNMVSAYKYDNQSALLTAMQKHLDIDGIIEEYRPGKFQYAAFNSNQIKDVSNINPTDSANIKKEHGTVEKFNPYHDKLGRFTSANGATSFTYRTKDSSKQHLADKAISRAKESATNEQKGRTYKLYHGSPNANIELLDIKHAGANTSSGEKLLFFTDNKEFADEFAYERLPGSSRYMDKKGKHGRVYEVEVNLKNPLDFRNLTDKDIDNILKLDIDGILTADEVKELASKNHQLLKSNLDMRAERLKELGYDGMIARARKDGTLEYAVVSNEQATIQKINPYHDPKTGRFTFAPGGSAAGAASNMKNSDGEQLSAGQAQYFADSKAVDENGNLVKLYHGTVHEFTEFDKSYSQPDSDVGAGIYLSNSTGDASKHYGNEQGPDLLHKIHTMSERLVREGMDEAEAEQLAKETFITSEPRSMECYVNMKNPIIIGWRGEKSTEFDMSDDDDGELDVFVAKMSKTISSSKYDCYDPDQFSEDVKTALYNEANDWGPVDAQTIFDTVSNLASDYNVTTYNKFGDHHFAGKEIARDVFEQMGYDGVIDKTVSSKFREMDLEFETTHYVVFNSNQVKLTSNMDPTDSADITKHLYVGRG